MNNHTMKHCELLSLKIGAKLATESKFSFRYIQIGMYRTFKTHVYDRGSVRHMIIISKATSFYS